VAEKEHLSNESKVTFSNSEQKVIKIIVENEFRGQSNSNTFNALVRGY
jgi:hypothetical protein